MLTAAQITDVRRYAGYGAARAAGYEAYAAPAFTRGFYYQYGLGLGFKDAMVSLSASEESVLINQFLIPLAKLEAAVIAAGDNLDTDVAAVWTRNKNEVADRDSLFRRKRMEMCDFLDMVPGPGLSGGLNSARVVRS